MVTKIQLNKIKQEVEDRMLDGNNSLHDIEHIKRVSNNAKRLVNALDLEDKLDKNLLSACCYLHDLTYSEKRLPLKAYFLEGRLVQEPVLEVLEIADIQAKDRETILNAVTKHPHSFPFKRLNKDKDIYTKLLQDADTIDVFNEKRINKLFNSKALRDIITKHFVKYGNKNLEKYLNHPEVADLFRSKSKYLGHQAKQY